LIGKVKVGLGKLVSAQYSSAGEIWTDVIVDNDTGDFSVAWRGIHY